MPCLLAIRHVCLLFLLELTTNNGSRAQQLGITCFKNFWTSFRIIEGTDKRESDKWGSTVATYVSKATFKKWQIETWNNYETMSWLCREVEKMPKHCVCKLFALIAKGMKTRYVCGMKRFLHAWVTRSSTYLTKSLYSNIVDHVNSD